MLFYTGLFLLVIAVSLDGFGVGVSYGIRKIHVPFLALVIIMFCSGMVVFLSMTIGNLLLNFISPEQANIMGGCILILLGSFSLFMVIHTKATSTKIKKTKNLDKKQFHHVKKVLKAPVHADLDQSGSISAKEAFLLGAALALDAFGAGIGASIIGYSPLLTTILIALMSGLFLFTGIQAGLLLSKHKRLQQMTYVPGLLLITLGMMNLF